MSRETDGSSGVGIGSGPASSGVGESSGAVLLGKLRWQRLAALCFRFVVAFRDGEGRVRAEEELIAFFGLYTNEKTKLEPDAAVILEESRAVTDAQVRALDAFLGRCTYTTTALLAVARWLRDLDDAEGAAMVEEFAERFAAHEAKTI